jgi:hypothetical protein
LLFLAFELYYEFGGGPVALCGEFLGLSIDIKFAKFGAVV